MKRTQHQRFQLKLQFFSTSFIRYFVFSFTLILLFTSCSKEEEIKVEEAKDITIDEVKAEFNSRKVQNANSRTSEASSVDIVWDLAVYKELAIGDVLFFPTKSTDATEGKKYVSSGEGTKRFPVDYTSFGRAYKDEDDIVVLEYIMPVPTANTAEFTGYFLVSDWGGEAKRIKFYENGNFVREAEVSQQSVIDGENNRSMASCTIIDHYWCVTASGGGSSYTTCTYEGSTMTCEAPTLAPPDPADPGLGGGGPSSPSGPGGLCAHPLIEGMWVDCDEVICSEGFEADANGECVPDCGENMVLDDEGNCILDCGPDMVPDGEGGCKPPGFRICNRYIAFDEIPDDYEESSFTGEMLNVNVPAIHSETGDRVSAFWGAWCVTYGTSATIVNSKNDASNIFKEAWELSTIEAEIWLNLQFDKPSDLDFSNYYKAIFEINLANLAGGVIYLTTGGGCESTSSTWLNYCNN